MPTLAITKTYSDGTSLDESDLDNIRTSVETFVNTTKLDASNIQDSAATSSKIAPAAVTESKLAANSINTAAIQDGAVTPAKLADDLQVVSWAMAGSLITGDALPWIRVPYGHTLVEAYALLKTAGSTATTVNIYYCSQTNIDGTPSWSSIFSTAITIDANEKSSNTAAAPNVIAPLSAARSANDHYKAEVTVVGTGAADLTVVLKLRRTS